MLHYISAGINSSIQFNSGGGPTAPSRVSRDPNVRPPTETSIYIFKVVIGLVYTSIIVHTTVFDYFLQYYWERRI
jgi:hypothetical protein